MKVKIVASCIWNVEPGYEEFARDLIEDKPGDMVLDYLVSAFQGSKGLSDFEVSVDEV